jgi:predicted ArsR family transcriptional regulator
MSRPLDPDSIRQRVMAHLLSEGGCWTADGIAAELQIDQAQAASALSCLVRRGRLRVLSSRRIPTGGRPRNVYEVNA